ncbi:N-acetyltransferase [Shewanella sp. OPT22]|nr:N-acetyltransferase [Shewanella sp. OPT22]
MQFRVPEILETDRLVLRRFNESDLEDIHRYFSDTVATQFTVRKSYSRLETWKALCVMIAHWQIKNYGPYAMVEKASKKVIGISGYWFPYDWPEAEIKWALVRNHWGKGYATEATKLVQYVALEYMPEMKLISFIHPKNEASIKLAMRLGCVLERKLPFRDDVWHVYKHPSQ